MRKYWIAFNEKRECFLFEHKPFRSFGPGGYIWTSSNGGGILLDDKNTPNIPLEVESPIEVTMEITFY